MIDDEDELTAPDGGWDETFDDDLTRNLTKKTWKKSATWKINLTT